MTNSTTLTKLFQPVTMAGHTLQNRIFLAPMTRSRASRTGVPSEFAAEYYAQRSEAGLVITEATPVCRQGSGYPVIPGLFSDEQEAGWKKIVDEVHSKGSRIFIQLVHTGRVGHSSNTGEALLAPSPIALTNPALTADFSMQPAETPREASVADIKHIISDFVAAARRAKRLGADGIELHGANGYLIDEFIRDGANRRSDAYGGAISNRLRFVNELITALESEVGGNFVGIRISPFGKSNDMSDSNPEQTFTTLANDLNSFQLAYLHISEDPAPLNISRQLRRAYRGFIIVGGGYDRPRAEAAVDSGLADAVSFGVAFLANPDLPTRLRLNAPLNAADPKTFYVGGAKGYIDYARLK